MRKLLTSGVGWAVILLLLTGCPPQYTLTVNVVGQGTVSLNPSGGTYGPNTHVTMSVTPEVGWHFGEWQGDVTGTTYPIVITMNNNKTVTAVFEENPPVTTEDSVRIVTFNTRLLPEFLDDFCCVEDNAWRAARYADAIKQAKYDIVILNEAFDEDARDVLVEQLKYEYPSYVSKLDYISGLPDVVLEDSGLMLFSRFPFEPLPNDDFMGGENPWDYLFGNVTNLHFLDFSHCFNYVAYERWLG